MMNSILIIDDSHGDQLLTLMTIEKYDPSIEILQAYDGQEALDMIAALASPPDAILLDINMPGMNGHEFLSEFSKREFPTCVVIMLTSSIQSRDKEQCRKYDFVKRYFDKPLGLDDLKELSELL